MKHLSETGYYAGRRLCLSTEGDSVHAMYAPLHRDEFRKTVCPVCLGLWAMYAYDDTDDMPDWVASIRSSSGSDKPNGSES